MRPMAKEAAVAKYVCAILVVAATLSVAFAQSPTEPGPAFDVVSIKRNTSVNPDERFTILPGGRLLGIAVQPFFLIRQAYEVQPDQILNAPEWVTSERYDINATMPGGVAFSMSNLPPLLRRILADRFQLVTRRDSRQLPVYRLLTTRADRQPGENLLRSPFDCANVIGRGPAANAISEPTPMNRFGMTACGIMANPGRILISGWPLSTLTRQLAAPLGRVVIDGTGLTGNWDLELKYALDGARSPDGAAASSDAPLVTALQDQLGLKLEAVRAEVDVILVESIQRPSEN